MKLLQISQIMKNGYRFHTVGQNKLTVLAVGADLTAQHGTPLLVDRRVRKLPAPRWLLCEDFETTRDYWLPRQSLSRPSCFPALADAQSRWNLAGISPGWPLPPKLRSIDHFYRSPANSWRLLCEYITTTCEYWLPRQSLSDPTGFSAPGEAQSRWNQPERPRRSILAA